MIEHFAGQFPLWLAPEQVVVIPVSEEKQSEAAKAALAALAAVDLRASVDWSNHKLGKKIRENAMRKVPYLLVIGDREAESGMVAVRRRDGTDLGAMPLADVIAALVEERRTRSLTPLLSPPAVPPAAESAPTATS